MESIWKKNIRTSSDYSKEPASDSNINSRNEKNEREIIIVGGGIAGLLCAYKLSESGHKVTLLEAKQILSGVTQNTTAHLNALQAKYKDIPTKKKRSFYFNAQMDGIDEIESIVNKHSIDCDFKRVDNYIYAQLKSRQLLKKEYKVLKEIKAPVEYMPHSILPFGSFDVIKLANQAVFNPAKFLSGLPKNFEIIENARVKDICFLTKTVKTKGKAFKANKIIIATNFPIVNIRGLYAFKMYKSMSYAINVKSDTKLNASYNSIENDGLTYRDSETGVIISGLDHRNGRIKSSKHYEQLTMRAKVFGDEITHRWVANDCMTFDLIPMAGKFRRFCKNIFLISGFGKWGMANSVISAGIVSDYINKTKNEYAGIYKPKRCLNIKVWHRCIINLGLDVGNLIKSFFGIAFKTHKSLKNGEGGIVTYKLRKRAIYKDEMGVLHIIKARCPHMYCQLKFNPDTKTWDCPCHGSRLAIDGSIISEPTLHCRKVKKVTY